MPTAVVLPQRQALDDAVPGQIGRGHEAAPDVHRRLGRCRDTRVAEPAHRPVAHRVQEPGQVGVAHRVTGPEQTAARGEHRAALRAQRHDRFEQAQDRRLSRGEHDPVGRQPAGRGDDGGQRRPPEAAVHVEVAGQASGHGRRAPAGVKDLLGPGEAHGHGREMRGGALASAKPGRVHEEVEHDGRTRDGPGHHEPTTAQAGEPGFGDGGGEAGSNGGVEGVAPRRQDRHGRLSGVRAASGDSCAHAGDYPTWTTRLGRSTAAGPTPRSAVAGRGPAGPRQHCPGAARPPRPRGGPRSRAGPAGQSPSRSRAPRRPGA